MYWLDGNPHGFGVRECKSESNNVGWKLVHNLAYSIYDHIYMTTQHGFKRHSGIKAQPCMTVQMLGHVPIQKRAKITDFFRRIPQRSKLTIF